MDVRKDLAHLTNTGFIEYPDPGLKKEFIKNIQKRTAKHLIRKLEDVKKPILSSFYRRIFDDLIKELEAKWK